VSAGCLRRTRTGIHSKRLEILTRRIVRKRNRLIESAPTLISSRGSQSGFVSSRPTTHRPAISSTHGIFPFTAVALPLRRVFPFRLRACFSGTPSIIDARQSTPKHQPPPLARVIHLVSPVRNLRALLPTIPLIAAALHDQVHRTQTSACDVNIFCVPLRSTCLRLICFIKQGVILCVAMFLLIVTETRDEKREKKRWSPFNKFLHNFTPHLFKTTSTLSREPGNVNCNSKPNLIPPQPIRFRRP
jgi:hypothetical protein